MIIEVSGMVLSFVIRVSATCMKLRNGAFLRVCGSHGGLVSDRSLWNQMPSTLSNFWRVRTDVTNDIPIRSRKSARCRLGVGRFLSLTRLVKEISSLTR